MTAITADMAGCWLDGHMGWHNTYRVIDLALDYGWKPDDQALVRHASEVYSQTGSFGEPIYPGDEEWAYDVIDDIADEATDYLQSLAPEGYWFEWDMGELCLVQEDAADE